MSLKFFLNYLAKKLSSPIAPILILALSLYCYQINFRGLWIDEFLSIRDAIDISFNKGRLLYYLLLNPWMKISDNETWLRVPSIIFAWGSIYLIYRLGTELFQKKYGLTSALLLTISPLFINHAQEVRYYTMSIFLGLLGSIGLGNYIKKKTYFSAFLWVIGRVLSFYTTPLNAVFLVADFLIVGIDLRQKTSRSKIISFLIVFLIIVSASLPVALSVIEDSGAHRLILPIPGISEVFRELRIMTAFSYPPPPPYISLFTQLLSLMSSLVIVIGIYKKPWQKELAWLTLWGMIPVNCVFFFSYIFYSVWNSRYLIMAQPYILLLLTIGFFKVVRWQKIIASILAFMYIATAILGLKTYYTSSARYMGALDHYRPVASLIESREKMGDVIIFSTVHGISLPLSFYYQGSATIDTVTRTEREKLSHAEDMAEWLKERLEQKLLVSDVSDVRIWFIYHGKIKNESLFQDTFEVQYQEKIGNANIFLLRSNF